MKSLIKAAIAFLFTLVAACIASAQTTANVTSKCLNCPPKRVNASPVSYTETTAYRGNGEANHAYPNHVEITNKATMAVDGTRFVKFKQFGFVLNYPNRFVQFYALQGTARRVDYPTTPVKLHPLLNGAKRFYESFYIHSVGECRFYYDAVTANVVGYSLEHWEWPDAAGQRVTHEGLTTEY